MTFNKEKIIEISKKKTTPAEAAAAAVDLTISELSSRHISGARRINSLVPTGDGLKKETVLFVEQVPVMAVIADLELKNSEVKKIYGTSPVASAMNTLKEVEDFFRNPIKNNSTYQEVVNDAMRAHVASVIYHAQDLFRPSEKINPNCLGIRIATISEMEKSLIIGALVIHNNNKKRAAQALGISKASLYLKINAYQLKDFFTKKTEQESPTQ